MKNEKNSTNGQTRGVIQPRLVLMCLLLAVFGIGLMAQLPERSAEMAEQRKNDADFREFSDLFAEIYHRIQNNYVEPVDNKKLFEGAINGMFSVLDPFSSWLPPEQQDMLTKDTAGEYSGIGLHITLDERRILTALLPMLGSPSARAGMQPWDRLIEINGESTEGISLYDAVKRLTGPEGSEVKIKVWRPSTNKLIDFTVRREQIKVESVFAKDLGEGIGYLRISKFQEDTSEHVRKALEDFNKQHVQGIILDVRYNAGGLLDRVQEIAEMFLERGQVIVSIKGRNAAENQVFRSRRDPISRQHLIVLVNEFSASASEILAGAVQDNKRGVILGVKGSHTYGKASVQTISNLKNSLDKDTNGDTLGSGLRLTTAHYYTPNGSLIMDKGIVPDIGIEVPEDYDKKLREHGLFGEPARIESTIDALNRQGPTTPTTEQKPAETQPEATAPGATPKDKTQTQRMIEMLQSGQPKTEEKKDEFRDVLLDEAIKYLKAIMIFDRDKRAAA